jgi:hypothetical protein
MIAAMAVHTALTTATRLGLLGDTARPATPDMHIPDARSWVREEVDDV